MNVFVCTVKAGNKKSASHLIWADAHPRLIFQQVQLSCVAKRRSFLMALFGRHFLDNRQEVLHFKNSQFVVPGHTNAFVLRKQNSGATGYPRNISTQIGLSIVFLSPRDFYYLAVVSIEQFVFCAVGQIEASIAACFFRDQANQHPHAEGLNIARNLAWNVIRCILVRSSGHMQFCLVLWAFGRTFAR